MPDSSNRKVESSHRHTLDQRSLPYTSSKEEYESASTSTARRGADITRSTLPSHIPPALFSSSFKRPRTISPPTSAEENWSEAETDANTAATPSSESEISSIIAEPSDTRYIKDSDSVYVTHSSNNSVGPFHPNQHTPLRFSFGMNGSSSSNKASVDGLMTEERLTIHDSEATLSSGTALPAYTQAMELDTANEARGTSNDVNSRDGKLLLHQITQSNQQPLQEGQLWYLVDHKWFRLWTLACGEGSNSRRTDAEELDVGPVETGSLLEEREGEQSFLRLGLLEGSDFGLLSSESWLILTAKYGSADAPIERKVVRMPPANELRIEMYPPLLRITCLSKKESSFQRSFSVKQTLGEMRKAVLDHLRNEGETLDYNVRFWRLPSQQSGPVTAEVLQHPEVEVIEDFKDSATLAEMQVDQPVVDFAAELRLSSSDSWPFDSNGKPTSLKGIFKQDGGDFLSRMQSGNSTASDVALNSVASGSNSGVGTGRVTRSQTAAERGSEKQHGLTGLYNLGNTCFMNAALQCMSNTKELKDYFVSGVWKSEVNTTNPLGMGGAMAKVFGELLSKLWTSSGGAWHPREFKMVLSRFSPQFTGYAQQDTQELLAFLLDGLHEDLNRIVKKPYIEAPDWEGGGLKEMVAFAHKQWEIYKLRNDSVIVDLFQGQYRSTLVCPDCNKVSIKFDPFMYLTLPIPNRKSYTRKVTYVPWQHDSKMPPTEVEMRLTGETSFATLKKNLGEWFNADPKQMAACDVFSRTFYRVYGDFEQTSEIGINDVTYVYELPAPLKPSASLPHTSGHYGRRGVRELEASNAKTKQGPIEEEMAILPVFSISKGSKGYSNYYNRGGGQAFGQPFFVAIPKESVDDPTAIQQAVLDKYRQYVSNAAALEDCLQDSIGATPKEDWSLLEHPTPSVVLPEVDGVNEDTVAEIHHDGETVHIVHTASAPASMEKRGNSSTATGKDRVVSFHFVLQRDDQSPITLKSDGFEDNGEELCARASRLTYSRKVDDQSMDVEQDEEAAGHKRDRTSAADHQTWPLVYTGGALVCVWTDTAKERIFGDEEAWGGGTPLPQFVDPVLEVERSVTSSGKKTKVTLTIEDCLSEFTKEEQLGESDPWYCPRCKDFKQATKKFDLWKVPDILVVHLKRFSSGRISRDKIDSFIDFPVEGLDLTEGVEGARAVSRLHEDEDDDERLMESIGSLGENDDAVESDAPIYDLYAVDNHYGGLGGGHYTAYAKNPEDDRWYYFDDSSVRAVSDPNEVKGSAAYLLFYRRRTTRPIGGKSREKVREKVKNGSPNAVDDEKAYETNQDQLNDATGDSIGPSIAAPTDMAKLDGNENMPWSMHKDDTNIPDEVPLAFSPAWDAVMEGRRTRLLSSSDGSAAASQGEEGEDANSSLETAPLSSTGQIGEDHDYGDYVDVDDNLLAAEKPTSMSIELS